MNLKAKPVKLADGFEFCEGPAFGPDGHLYVVNLNGGYVDRVTLDGQRQRYFDTPGPNGQNFNSRGDLLICEVRKKAVIAVTPDRQVETLVESFNGEKLNGPNDIAVDLDNGFYFTDPEGSSAKNPIGCVYYMHSDGQLARVACGMAYPNGIAISADRRSVMVAETLAHKIHRFERRSSDLAWSQFEFCTLEGGVGPDGMCFDQEGRLYVAMFGTGRVEVIDPSGKIEGALIAPGQNLTNCCFGPPGTEWQTHLFVTDTTGNAVWRFDVGVPGLPLHPLAPK